jgi:hypothetical protein
MLLMALFRTIILVVLLAAAPAVLMAQPFLVSDPYPAKEVQPTKFVVTVGGKSFDVVPEKNPDGSSFLKYDLSHLPDGIHAVKVKAVNSTLNQESPEMSLSLQKTGSTVTRAKDESEKIAPSRTFPGYIRP